MSENFVLNQFSNPLRKLIDAGGDEMLEKKIPVEQRLQRDWEQFEDRRDTIGQEIIKTVEDIKRLMDMLLAAITKELTDQATETDQIVDECFQESKRILNKKQELKKAKAKLSSVLAVLNSA